jgi:hypothetical protein
LRRSLLLSFALVAIALFVSACGGDDDGSDTPSPQATPSAQDSIDATRTEEANAAVLGDLANALLAQGDVPEGYELRVSEPVTRAEAAAANVGIPRLGGFLQNSDLVGAWASFYLRAEPQTGLTSIVFEFPSAESAQAFVDVISSLTARDYPEAVSVERVQSDKIEDKAQMMLYRLAGGRAYDFTWTQGRYAGQIVLRHAGDRDNPEDRSLMVALARRQADLMRALEQ